MHILRKNSTRRDFLKPWARYKKRHRHNEVSLSEKICKYIDNFIYSTQSIKFRDVEKLAKKKFGKDSLYSVYLDVFLDRIVTKTIGNRLSLNNSIDNTILEKSLHIINELGCNMPRNTLMNILELDLKLTVLQRKKLEERLFYSENSIFFDEGTDCSYVVDTGDVLEVCVHSDGMDIYYKGMVMSEKSEGFTICTQSGSIFIPEDKCSILNFTKDI